jgi:segregation and condensation protein B
MATVERLAPRQQWSEESAQGGPGATVTVLPRPEVSQHLRILEAVLFAAAEPLAEADIAKALPEGVDVNALLHDIQRLYAGRGVNVVRVAGKWCFRTADDLSFLLRREAVESKRLSKAALETLAIIAYHQPVTRAEIEDVRGVIISKGTLDQLLEIGWIRMRGRRKAPGRPVTYGVTEAFLSHFGLGMVTDLPGLNELKAAGLLDANLPPDFDVPTPATGEELAPDEEPLEDEEQPALEMDLPEQPESRSED